MKRGVVSAAVMLTTLCVGRSASAQVTLLDTGRYGGVQLPSAIPGSPWLTLCRTSAGAELRATSMTLRPFFDQIAGDKPGQKSGREVRASGCKKVLALLSDTALKAGPVRDAQIEKDGIRFAGVRFGILSSEASTAGDVPARLHLQTPQGAVLLIENAEGGSIEYKIRWAGDLDNDGGLDLVVEEKDDGTRVYLFLSRSKPVDGRWSPAAITYRGGC